MRRSYDRTRSVSWISWVLVSLMLYSPLMRGGSTGMLAGVSAGCQSLLDTSVVVSTNGPDGVAQTCSSGSSSSSGGGGSDSSTGDSSSSTGAVSFVIHKKGARGMVRPHSFVQETLSAALTRDENDSSSFSFCFSPPSSDVAEYTPYAEFMLSSAYVITGASFTSPANGPSGFTMPSSFKIGSLSTSNQYNFYTSSKDAAGGLSWSSLAAGTDAFDGDFAGQNIRVYPLSESASSPQAFAVQLFGCPASSTAKVSFRFGTTMSALSTRFSSDLSYFASQIVAQVCIASSLSSSGSTCDRVVFVGAWDDTASSVAGPVFDETTGGSSSVGNVAPGSFNRIIVTLRLLPPADDCVDCRTAAQVASNLASTLGAVGSSGYNLMRNFENWIQDTESYSCNNKVCPADSYCISGTCVSASAASLGANGGVQAIANSVQSYGFITNRLSVSSVANSAGASVPSFPDYSFDTVLNHMTPLQVITGAPQSGNLQFAEPTSPGVLSDSSALTAQSASSAVADTGPVVILKRYFIPIAACVGVFVIILLLVGVKVYKRSSLTEEQKALVA